MNTAKATVSGRKTKADATISEYPDCSHDTQKDIIRILESKKVAEVTMSKRTKCETWLYPAIGIIVVTIIYIQAPIIWIAIMLAMTVFWLFFVLNKNTRKYRLVITFSSGEPFILESYDKKFLLSIKQMALETKINAQ